MHPAQAEAPFCEEAFAYEMFLPFCSPFTCPIAFKPAGTGHQYRHILASKAITAVSGIGITAFFTIHVQIHLLKAIDWKQEPTSQGQLCLSCHVSGQKTIHL